MTQLGDKIFGSELYKHLHLSALGSTLRLRSTLTRYFLQCLCKVWSCLLKQQSLYLRVEVTFLGFLCSLASEYFVGEKDSNQ